MASDEALSLPTDPEINDLIRSIKEDNIAPDVDLVNEENESGIKSENVEQVNEDEYFKMEEGRN